MKKRISVVMVMAMIVVNGLICAPCLPNKTELSNIRVNGIAPYNDFAQK